MNDETDHAPAGPGWRQLFWSVREHADLTAAMADGRTEEVSYKIPGHGSGWYLRVAGMPIIGLVRYDTRESHFPHGSILIPRHHPQWRPYEPADRNRWLGSEDPGDPITRKDAEQCIVDLGLPITKLDELRMAS